MTAVDDFQVVNALLVETKQRAYLLESRRRGMVMSGLKAAGDEIANLADKYGFQKGQLRKDAFTKKFEIVFVRDATTSLVFYTPSFTASLHTIVKSRVIADIWTTEIVPLPHPQFDFPSFAELEKDLRDLCDKFKWCFAEP